MSYINTVAAYLPTTIAYFLFLQIALICIYYASVCFIHLLSISSFLFFSISTHNNERATPGETSSIFLTAVISSMETIPAYCKCSINYFSQGNRLMRSKDEKKGHCIIVYTFQIWTWEHYYLLMKRLLKCLLSPSAKILVIYFLICTNFIVAFLLFSKYTLFTLSF